MKTLLTIFIYLSSIGITSISNDNVYICDSKTAKAYHKSKSCKGLQKCTHAIKEITLKEAKEKGRTACKTCY